jgi:hypothetical protein
MVSNPAINAGRSDAARFSKGIQLAHADSQGVGGFLSA